MVAITTTPDATAVLEAQIAGLRQVSDLPLPTGLAADDSSGGPDGHREVEGVTPKEVPAPSPVSVENNDQLICVEKPSQKPASDDQ
jgi:hypothetical protein